MTIANKIHSVANCGLCRCISLGLARLLLLSRANDDCAWETEAARTSRAEASPRFPGFLLFDNRVFPLTMHEIVRASGTTPSRVKVVSILTIPLRIDYSIPPSPSAILLTPLWKLLSALRAALN